MSQRSSFMGLLPRRLAIGPYLLLLVVVACGRAPELQKQATEEWTSREPVGQVLTVGDIDPDTPAHRIRRITPLADYLAQQLADDGMGSGQVVIARDIDEMARMLDDGTVDVYIDSTFPSISVRALVGSEILLAGSIRGVFEHYGIFVTSRPEVNTLEDLRGQVVAFEERHSTSGYLLPYTTLRKEGLDAEKVERPDAKVQSDKVGYYFSRDEENSLVLALDGTVAAAAISNNDWEELPAAHREQMRIVARTSSVPRQLVSLRPGVDDAVRAKLEKLLLEITPDPLEDHPEAWVWDFRELSEESRQSLDMVEGLAKSIEEE